MTQEAATVREILLRRDLILVTGKGGTGKSTVVAALAELAARLRGAAVAVEMSAHSRLPELLGPGAPVQVLNLDAERVVYPSLARLIHLPALAARMLDNRILRSFIRTSPAIREMIVLDQLCHELETHAQQGRPLVVDLPASGHALSFLDTPRAVHRTVRIGPLAAIAARVEALILDASRAHLMLVALPEELPVNETIELVQRAREIGLVNHTILMNQVPAHPVKPEDRDLLAILERQDDPALARYLSVARDRLEGADQARAQVDRLRATLGEPVIELPLTTGTNLRDCVTGVLEALAA